MQAPQGGAAASCSLQAHTDAAGLHPITATAAPWCCSCSRCQGYQNQRGTNSFHAVADVAILHKQAVQWERNTFPPAASLKSCMVP